MVFLLVQASFSLVNKIHTQKSQTRHQFGILYRLNNNTDFYSQKSDGIELIKPIIIILVYGSGPTMFLVKCRRNEDKVIISWWEDLWYIFYRRKLAATAEGGIMNEKHTHTHSCAQLQAQLFVFYSLGQISNHTCRMDVEILFGSCGMEQQTFALPINERLAAMFLPKFKIACQTTLHYIYRFYYIGTKCSGD